MNTQNTKSTQSSTYIQEFRRKADNESGAVLVVVLLILLVLAGLVPAAVNMSRNDFTRTVSYEEGKESFYIADAGVHKAKALMAGQYKDDILDNGDSNSGIINRGGTIVTKNGIKYNEVSYGGGKFWFRLDDNVESDGNPFNDDDNIVEITAIGQVDDGPEKTIKATMWKMDLPPQTFPSALTMVGPVSVLNSSGAAFNVNGANAPGGNGLDLAGNPDANCPGKNAVSFESSGTNPVETKTKMSTGPDNCENDAVTNTCVVVSTSGNNANFTGVGGTGTDMVTGQTTYTSNMAGDLWDLITNDSDGDGNPDLVTTSNDCGGNSCYSSAASNNFTGNQTWGSASNPVMAYMSGDVNLGGSITGYGILIIDGDFDFSGTINWNGIILVGVCPTCSSTANDASGTGNGTINGAFVVGNGTVAQVNITGNVAVNYSCEGIDIANQIFAGTGTIVAWNEEGA